MYGTQKSRKYLTPTARVKPATFGDEECRKGLFLVIATRGETSRTTFSNRFAFFDPWKLPLDLELFGQPSISAVSCAEIRRSQFYLHHHTVTTEPVLAVRCYGGGFHGYQPISRHLAPPVHRTTVAAPGGHGWGRSVACVATVDVVL